MLGFCCIAPVGDMTLPPVLTLYFTAAKEHCAQKTISNTDINNFFTIKL